MAAKKVSELESRVSAIANDVAALWASLSTLRGRVSKMDEKKKISVGAVYCEDCKWCMPSMGHSSRANQMEFARCSHPANGAEVVVARGVSGAHCSIARKHGPCSADGKLYEPKPQQIVRNDTPRKRWWRF